MCLLLVRRWGGCANHPPYSSPPAPAGLVTGQSITTRSCRPAKFKSNSSHPTVLQNRHYSLLFLFPFTLSFFPPNMLGGILAVYFLSSHMLRKMQLTHLTVRDACQSAARGADFFSCHRDREENLTPVNCTR